MISIICAVKNRFDSLSVSLSSWILSKTVDEIVLVDWSSDEPISKFSNLDKRIKIIRVDNMKNFNLSASFNLAADCAKQQMLLKLDSDYIINPFDNDLAFCAIPTKYFLTGNFQHGGPFFSYLNGLIAVRKEDWQLVNGYNENLIGYGWDDDDFYIRLQNSGLKRAILEPVGARVFHIPHDDKFRTKEYVEKDKSLSYYYNRKKAEKISYTNRIFSWEINQTAEQLFVARQKK